MLGWGGRRWRVSKLGSCGVILYVNVKRVTDVMLADSIYCYAFYS